LSEGTLAHRGWTFGVLTGVEGERAMGAGYRRELARSAGAIGGAGRQRDSAHGAQV
jgi:hypothetical protein